MKLSFIFIILFLIWQGIMKGGGGGNGEAIPAMAVYGSYYDEIWEELLRDANEVFTLDSTTTWVDSTLNIWSARSGNAGENADTLRVGNEIYGLSVIPNEASAYNANLYVDVDGVYDDIDNYIALSVRETTAPRFAIYVYDKTSHVLTTTLYSVTVSSNPNRFYLIDHSVSPQERLYVYRDLNKMTVDTLVEGSTYNTIWTKTWTSEEDRPRYPYRGGIIK